MEGVGGKSRQCYCLTHTFPKIYTIYADACNYNMGIGEDGFIHKKSNTAS